MVEKRDVTTVSSHGDDDGRRRREYTGQQRVPGDVGRYDDVRVGDGDIEVADVDDRCADVDDVDGGVDDGDDVAADDVDGGVEDDGDEEADVDGVVVTSTAASISLTATK